MDKTPISFGLNILKPQNSINTNKNEPLTLPQSVRLNDNIQPAHFSGKFVTAEQYLKTQPNISFLSLNKLIYILFSLSKPKSLFLTYCS